MEQPSWATLVVIVVTNVVALYIGLTTKPGPDKPDSAAYQLKSWARIGGLMIGIAGWIPAFRLLLDLLNQNQ